MQKVLNSAASGSADAAVPIAVIPNAKSRTVSAAATRDGVVRLIADGQDHAHPVRASDVYAITERSVMVY